VGTDEDPAGHHVQLHEPAPLTRTVGLWPVSATDLARPREAGGRPTRFVLGTEDRFFPPAFMRRVVADRLGVVPDEITAGHAVALSRPRAPADLLAGFAATAG
jgi:hypothetical protein